MPTLQRLKVKMKSRNLDICEVPCNAFQLTVKHAQMAFSVACPDITLDELMAELVRIRKMTYSSPSDWYLSSAPRAYSTLVVLTAKQEPLTQAPILTPSRVACRAKSLLL